MQHSDHSGLHSLLLRMDPETAHNLSLRLLALAGRIGPVRRWLANLFTIHDPRLESEVLGLRFCNPVGIAAGYDKNATSVLGFASLGAGHVEVGTITPLLQRGNPRPRVFRLLEDEALINRMGFPNIGAAAVAPRLAELRSRHMLTQLGLNIGKGKNTSLEHAADDYGELLRKLHPYADYVVVNLSSPNTRGLRQLQARGPLDQLLEALMELREQVCPLKPVLLKIAPDLSMIEVDDVIAMVTSHRLSGVIATNTTVRRDGLRSAQYSETGGLSGVPLRTRANEIIRHIYRQTGGALSIIGVGGVDSAAAALEKLNAGANLVQVYTGMVYRGPGLLRDINVGLLGELDKQGLASVTELVGTTG